MLDGEIDLVVGAFSADPDARRIFLAGHQRVYLNYQTMALAEAGLPVAKRMIDFVAIVTPNLFIFPVDNLTIRVYGAQASLEWYQEDPNDLVVKYPDAPPAGFSTRERLFKRREHAIHALAIRGPRSLR